jgi:hypothetical protein
MLSSRPVPEIEGETLQTTEGELEHGNEFLLTRLVECVAERYRETCNKGLENWILDKELMELLAVGTSMHRYFTPEASATGEKE